MVSREQSISKERKIERGGKCNRITVTPTNRKKQLKTTAE